METIPSITEGMTWAEAFGIINQVIDAVNSLNEAIGGALVDGKVDYNTIVNRPHINGVELVGDLTQEELEISIDGETLEKIDSLSERIDGVEESLSEKVEIDNISTILQEYARIDDIPDVSGLASQQDLTDGLAAKVGVTNFAEVLAQINTSIASKASAGEVPTTVQWNNLMTQMEAKVTQAGNSATAAANSATTCSNQCAIAVQKATEATTAAQEVSGALNRIAALETTVNGGSGTSGVVVRIQTLENRVGDVGKKTSISADLKESRVKTNDLLEALKAIPGEVYDKVKDIVELDVNY